MRVLLGLILGLALGAAVVWYFMTGHSNPRVQSATTQAQQAVRSAGDAIQDRLRGLNLRPEDIRAELERSGQVVRRKAEQAGQAISDATADARITAAIKAKLLKNQAISSLSISVNTSDGIVTLSGTVPSADAISQAMLAALETDGVKQVISTLQVKPPSR